MRTFEVKDDPRSLNRPGWDSESLTLTQLDDREYELEGKFCSLRTTRAIFSRVQIIKETRSTLIVRFLTFDRKIKKFISVSDVVQKREVLNIRVYQD